MIIQIDIKGRTVIEKYDTVTSASKHFDKEIKSHISLLLARKDNRCSAVGFLWARVDPTGKTTEEIELEAINQVQDCALQLIINNFNVWEKNLLPSVIEKLIFELDI